MASYLQFPGVDRIWDMICDSRESPRSDRDHIRHLLPITHNSHQVTRSHNLDE